MIGPGDEVVVFLPSPEPSTIIPEDIPLDVVFEDDSLLVVNKPAGMVVHPACGHKSGTLVNALLHHCGSLSMTGQSGRPGIVHRLDKDTSGLLVVAKRDDIHMALARQIEVREATRRYTAVVWGHPSPQNGMVDEPVARHPAHRQRMAVVQTGKPSVTHYNVVDQFAFCSLLSLKLDTGRTHQIRVHMAYRNNPVFGDSVYGGRAKRLGALNPADRKNARAALGLIERQALHASELSFRHPGSEAPVRCTAPLPHDMVALLKFLKKDYS